MMIKYNIWFSFLISAATFASSETITDGSLGEKVNLGSSSFEVPQTLGKTIGNNLFHSFSQFNINTGQTATFTGANTLQNVITRVTGGEVSNIEGTLKSQVGNADFYFINPAGVTFGQNAVVDVPAAFHVSTANNLQFKDGKVFDSANSSASSLSSGTPESFGFVNGSVANNGLLAVTGSHLAVKPEQKLDLVARNIEIKSVENQDASLTANAGFIRLAGMKEGKVNVDGFSLPNEMPGDKNAGNITVDGRDSKLKPIENIPLNDFAPGNISLDSTGNGGGNFSVWCNQCDFYKTQAWSDNKGDTDIDVVKKVNVHAHDLLVNNSTITFDVAIKSKGNGGEVIIQANKIDLIDGGVISSNTRASGNAGNVKVYTEDLRIDGKDNSKITGITSSQALTKEESKRLASGDGGNIDIEAKNIWLLHNGAISSSTWSSGNAGLVNVKTNNLYIDNQNSDRTTGIISQANVNSKGNAGTVNVLAKRIDLLNAGGISSDSWSSGNSGNVIVNADVINMSGAKITQTDNVAKNARISASSNSPGGGTTGNVAVTASDSLTIANSASISAVNKTVQNDDNKAREPKNTVKIVSPVIYLENDGKISTNATGNQAAENIIIEAEKKFVAEDSQVLTTANEGNGGEIAFNRTGIIDLTNSSLQTTVKSSFGNGGNINMNAEILVMNSAAIQANAQSGNGGDINLKIDALISSASTLIKGGKQQVWQPHQFGFNLIQAASASGVSGNVNSSAPELNLSGIIANLGQPSFNFAILEQNACANFSGSSLTRVGNGGLPRRSWDLMQ